MNIKTRAYWPVRWFVRVASRWLGRLGLGIALLLGGSFTAAQTAAPSTQGYAE